MNDSKQNAGTAPIGRSTLSVYGSTKAPQVTRSQRTPEVISGHEKNRAAIEHNRAWSQIMAGAKREGEQ